MNRRNALAGVSLVALAACTSPTADVSVQTVFADVQFILPLLGTLAAGIAIAVPQSAGIVAIVTPYLTQAATAFQSLSATMTAVQAMPIVSQIEAYLQSAVDAVANLINGAAVGSTLIKFAPQIQQAEAVLALIMAFVKGLQAAPLARVQGVSLPYLHR
jgi:hypothetical protein